MSNFNSINEGDIFLVRVLGQRFELNDKQISIIGELVIDKEKNDNKKKREQLNYWIELKNKQYKTNKI